MLLSMTGFSTLTANLKLSSFGEVSLTIDLKTINSRFFESINKLPSLLSGLEVSINSLLQNSLLRGRVYVTIRMGRDNEIFESIVLGERALEGYIAAAKTIKEKFGVEGNLTLHDLMQLPNIFIAERKDLTESDEKAVLDLVCKAADALNKTRREEGQSLQNDIESRLSICSSKIEEIRIISEQLMSDQKKLIVSLNDSAQGGDEKAKIDLDNAYATLNKIDIAEEVTRFKSHCASVNTFLATNTLEKGKRLDFILQELMREANTTMSKCSNYSISSAAVDIKVELEKIREQVQNIV